MRLTAPAKLNLLLRVAPVDATGFHPLASWMVTLAMGDELHFAPALRPGFTLHCDAPNVPLDETNLVIKAAQTLSRFLPDAQRDLLRGVSVHLTKRIPMGAGLGGGSSDAATTLLALNRLWNLSLPLELLQDVAAQIGSDVPFFLSAPSAWCTGRGDKVEPIALPKPKHVLLMMPTLHCSTAEVYKRFDELQLGQDVTGGIYQPRPALGLPALPLLSQLTNDLQPAAFSLHPRLKDIHELSQAALKRKVLLTGSGSCLFTLYDSAGEAAEGKTALPENLNAIVTQITGTN